MTDNVINFQDLPKERFNYLDVFHDNAVRIAPYNYGIVEKLTALIAPVLFGGIAVGVFFEENDNMIEKYFFLAFFAILCVLSIYALYDYFIKKNYEVFIDYLGFKRGSDGRRVLWRDVKRAKFDFLGLKIVEKNGAKHRVYLNRDDNDYYFMDEMIRHFVWLNNKTELTNEGLITNFLKLVKNGFVFGDETAIEQRRNDITFRVGALAAIMVALAFVCLILFVSGSLMNYIDAITLFIKSDFDTAAFDSLKATEWKGLIKIGILVLGALFVAFRLVQLMLSNTDVKMAQVIKVNDRGMEITYKKTKIESPYIPFPLGGTQKVSWKKVQELWDDPTYGDDGLYYAINHQTDGGTLLIDGLEFAVAHFVHDDKTFLQD